MKKHVRRFLLLSLVIFLVAASFSWAQIRGKALYEKLSQEKDLVKFEGLTRLTWTPDGSAYYLLEDESFVRIDPNTGAKTPLFNDAAILAAYNQITHKNVEKLPFSRFSYLGGGKKIQFLVGSIAYIYDFAQDEMVSYVPQQQILGVRGRMYGEAFSPDFKLRAYTRDYNLYVQDIDGKETALTTDGHKDLRNGFPDWVYPEELSQYQAFWWSPDSKKIAFMQFDESPVTKYPLVHDVAPRPELEMQSYPKAGANNPIVTFYIADIETKKLTRIESGLDTNVYLFRGQWTPDGKYFTYQRLNRWQNVIELFAADPATGKIKQLLRDEDPCYIQANFDLRFLGDNLHFIWTSERSGWREIYLYSLEGKLIRQLTDTKLPISRIAGVDEKNGWVYFSGAENRGMESHFYRVKLDGTGFTKLTKSSGGHSVSLSPDAKYFTDSFSSFDSPRRVTLHHADSRIIRELGHSVVTQEFKDLNLIKPELFSFKSADNRHDLDGILFKPAHFDKNKKYPLILSVYGGPGAKRIYNRYQMNSGSQTLAQLGFIVISIDHRGISGRGKAFQNLMYLNLGEIELADHVAAAKFIGSRSYVDENRVGIYGHSYGGYMTCIALLKAPDVFHVGVAGAPVTDWRNYDTIYTERYMRRPQDNPDGYEKGSCMNYAKDLKGHLAIHHGAVDDNVHPGNSIQLINALLKAGKRFDFMFYPEQMHGIRYRQYGEARIDYFIRHLKPDVN